MKKGKVIALVILVIFFYNQPVIAGFEDFLRKEKDEQGINITDDSIAYHHFIETGINPWEANHFEITQVEQVIAEGIAGILNINHVPSLTTFAVTFLPFAENALQTILDAVQTNEQIVSFLMQGNNLNYIDATAISQMLKTNRSIRRLYLCENKNIGPEGAKAIAEMLLVNNNIELVDLTRNGIGDVGAYAIANILSENITLVNLNLDENNISANGVIALANALRTNTTLRELHISYNHIEQEGIVAFAEALRVNRALTTFSIDIPEINEEETQTLIEALRANRNLTEIYLRGNRRTAQTIAGALPEIVHLGALYENTGTDREIPPPQQNYYQINPFFADMFYWLFNSIS